MKASDIPFKPVPAITERVFRVRGDQRYSYELIPTGITFEVDRLRRHSQELWGEVSVTVNGHFPEAKTIETGILSIGDLNFSSVQARGTRGKLLEKRSGSSVVDWEGFVEEFAYKVITAERSGRPAVVLADVPDPPEDRVETWEVLGLPIVKGLPMIIFGDSDSGKSYFAMYVAGTLANLVGPVLYADWEFSETEHKKRLKSLFQPMPRGVIYANCDRPLVHEIDRLSRLAREHKCVYAVNDSIGFAVNGPAESQEGASEYFRALRQLGIGSLNIAHIPKHREEGKDPSIFGSAFFRAGARSVWFIERAQENPSGEIRFGLYHRKNNLGDKLAPRGYRLAFRGPITRVEVVDVETVDELAAQLPLLDRMKRLLKRGGMLAKDLAEELNTTAAIVRAMVSRHQSQFIRVGKKISLRGEDLEF